MNYDQLKKTANGMVVKGKGILAADESTPTCTKRFESINVESTIVNRNKYRDLLFSTPGMEEYISGVIMYDETIRQSTIDMGIPFAEYLMSKNVIPGIKVDMGVKPLALHFNEKITEGLDGLQQRLENYYTLGARFAKWRAVITIGDGTPTNACINANAHALARYAALCQETSIVPIVEPEIIMDGNHTVLTCYDVSIKTFSKVFEELDMHNIYLEGIVLKPNMVVSGIGCLEQASVEEVSERTVECLRETVPDEVPGCAFLSGGQSNQDATAHLNKMNAEYGGNLPWNLTFSYGRALQNDALVAWGGENREKGQEALYYRAKCNSYATKGLASDMLKNAL